MDLGKLQEVIDLYGKMIISTTTTLNLTDMTKSETIQNIHMLMDYDFIRDIISIVNWQIKEINDKKLD